VNDTTPVDVPVPTGGKRNDRWRKREFCYGYMTRDHLSRPLIEASSPTNLVCMVKDWGNFGQNRTPIGVVDHEFAQNIYMPRWDTTDVESTLLSFGQRVGLARPEYTENQLKLMRFVTDRMNDEVIPLPPDEFFDFETYLKQNKKWTELEKEEMRRHFDLYCETLRIDKNTTMFVKWEPGDEFKVCRLIFSVTLDIKVSRGPEIKAMEDWYFSQIRNHVKHLTSEQRLKYIKDTLGDILDDEYIKSTDFRRFEHIFTKGMLLNVEVRHFLHMIKNNPSKNHLLAQMVDQTDWNKFITARRTYICYLAEKRKSGYSETSYFNYFTNRVLNTCMYWHMYHDVTQTDPWAILETKTIKLGDPVPSDRPWHIEDCSNLAGKIDKRLSRNLDIHKQIYLKNFNEYLALKQFNAKADLPLNYEHINKIGISKYQEIFGILTPDQVKEYNQYLNLVDKCYEVKFHAHTKQEKLDEWENFVTWAETYGYLSRRVFEGDDGIFIVKAEFKDMVNSYYKMVGVEVKSETHKQLNTASFCGLVFDDSEKLFRNPLTTIAKFPILDPKYARVNPDKLKALSRVKAMSLYSECKNCPILSAYALAVITFTSAYHKQAINLIEGGLIRKNMSSYEYDHFLLNLGNWRDSPTEWLKSYQRPSLETFLQYARTYNLEAQEVIDVHNLFEDVFKKSVPQKFPRTDFFYDHAPMEWKFYAGNYVHWKTPDDICHAFMMDPISSKRIGEEDGQGYKLAVFQPLVALKGVDRIGHCLNF
jgi:hypothetical protein